MSWGSWGSIFSSCILNPAAQGAHNLPTSFFLAKVKVRNWKETSPAVLPPNSGRSCIIQMEVGRSWRKPDLISNCWRSFSTQSFLQPHRTAVNVTPLPITYINWLNGIAQPLAHTESFLMMHFYLLCCPAHLPASPRLANIFTLSSVSQENVYSRLSVIFWSGLLFQKVRFAGGLPPCADVQHLLFMERCCPDVWCFKGKWLLLTGTWFYLLWQSLWALNPF